MSLPDDTDPGTALDGLLKSLADLLPEDLLTMAQLWSEEDGAARSRAWQRAKAAIQRDRRAELLDDARERIGAWMRASQSDYSGISGLLGQEGGHVSMRRDAAPALLDAAAGLLARAELHTDDYDVLSRPYRLTLEEAEG